MYYYYYYYIIIIAIVIVIIIIITHWHSQMFKTPNLQFTMQLLKAVKCNSTELTKLAVICICAWIWIPCALLLRHSYMCFEWELAAFWGMPAHHPGSFPHPFPPSFHCLFSVTGACFPSQCGAHGWVTKNC